jgi:hypothetical protein
MDIVQLRINGNYVEGLSGSSVKLTVNNISPVTMTGDSVAFSATIKVPRSANNDRVFKNLQQGFHECVFYDCKLFVRSLPFQYMGYDVEFYAKVTYNGGNYNISLVENTERWSDEEIRLQHPLVQVEQMFAGWLNATRVVNLEKVINDHVTWKEGTFPKLTPKNNEGASIPEPIDAARLKPTIMIFRSSIVWDNDVASGNMTLVPKEYTKGRGGYIYPSIAQVVISDTMKALYATLFGQAPNGQNPGFNLRSGVGRDIRMIVEYTGATIPDPLPELHIVGESTNLTGGKLYPRSRLTDRIWLYGSSLNDVVFVTPTKDKYMIVKGLIGGSKVSCFKFPDGYAPEELIDLGDGAAEVLSAYSPASGTVVTGTGFPYSDVRKLIDDLCTAFHWRKQWRNNTLSIEPIININIRDKTGNRHQFLEDWSSKFISVDTIETPDEFADQLVTQVGDVKYSYSTGPGTLTPVKDAYKSGLPFAYNFMAFPKVALTSKFTTGGTATYVTALEDIYRSYIKRHFKLFAPRMLIKIKARLDYNDVINLKLDRAYYFSQLGGWFYLKSLGEYDVTKGDCKLSLYKLDLMS